MTAARATLAILLAVIAGAAWPPGAGDLGLRPDFLLLVALAAGLQGEGDAGPWTGIAAGLAAAALTLEPFGWDAALFGAAGIGAARVRHSLRADRVAVQAALAGTAGLLLGLARLARMEAAGGDAETGALIPGVLAGAAATAAAAPAVLFLLDAAGVSRARRPAAGRASLV